jgi:hypothetical protein
VAPVVNNIPTIVDATPAVNVRLTPAGGSGTLAGGTTGGGTSGGGASGGQPGIGTPNTAAAGASAERPLAMGLLAAAAAIWAGRRRRFRARR